MAAPKQCLDSRLKAKMYPLATLCGSYQPFRVRMPEFGYLVHSCQKGDGLGLGGSNLGGEHLLAEYHS